jgi:hypothetical protein
VRRQLHTKGAETTSVGLAAVVFATCNGVRIMAYFPQIARLVRDHEGAKGASCLTCAGFAASNLSADYALVVI